MTEKEAINKLRDIQFDCELLAPLEEECIDMAVKALEKQIPKKPTTISGMCKCGKFVNQGNYCSYCGQKLDLD